MVRFGYTLMAEQNGPNDLVCYAVTASSGFSTRLPNRRWQRYGRRPSDRRGVDWLPVWTTATLPGKT